MWDPPCYDADADRAPKEEIKNYLYPIAFGLNAGSISAAELERTRALYFGLVTFVDRWIGYLLDKIEALGMAEETIVTFVTHHGTEVGDRGHFCKGGDRLYPFNTWLNWITRHPQGPAGATCDAWVQRTCVRPCSRYWTSTTNHSMASTSGRSAPEPAHRFTISPHRLEEQRLRAGRGACCPLGRHPPASEYGADPHGHR